MVHHLVGVGQTSNHAMLAALICRLASQVPSKQEPGADLLRLKGAGQLKATDGCALPDADGETEPAWVRATGRFRQNQQVLQRFELALQIGKILLAAPDQLGQLGELRSSESSLHIYGLQVVPDVRIGVLVIVAARQGTELPLETLATRVVLAGLAPAIATPIAKRFDKDLQSRLICKDGSAFSGCNVVGRIKAQSGDIAKGAHVPSLIGRTQRIAAVFDQPKIMPTRKGGDRV